MTDPQADLRRFEHALSEAVTDAQAFDALRDLSRDLVGAKLFTVMTADMQAMLARRAYTDDPVNYPTSGTKPIEIDRWFEQVHGRHQSFVANTLAEIDTVFPDAELIGRLGCGSVINLPIILGGAMVATVNMLHVEGYYTPDRVALVHDILTVPAMATMAVVRQFTQV